jgi:hypothetical protein
MAHETYHYSHSQQERGNSTDHGGDYKESDVRAAMRIVGKQRHSKRAGLVIVVLMMVNQRVREKEQMRSRRPPDGFSNSRIPRTAMSRPLQRRKN